MAACFGSSSAVSSRSRSARSALRRRRLRSRADSSVFGGLGTWVDIYDGPVYAAPERTAQRMSTRDVKTVWVETANYGAAVDVVNPIRLGRLVDALHARGIRVVAWYLPGHVKPALDLAALARDALVPNARGRSVRRRRTRHRVDEAAKRGSSLASEPWRSRGSFARPPATRRSRSSRSTRAGSSGARPRGRGSLGPSSPRAPTRSRR